MVELDHFWSPVCSVRVRMALEEKRVAWTSRYIDLFKLDQLTPLAAALMREFCKACDDGFDAVATLTMVKYILTELRKRWGDEVLRVQASRLSALDGMSEPSGERARRHSHSPACDVTHEQQAQSSASASALWPDARAAACPPTLLKTTDRRPRLL
jgi:hypothetical protein